MKKEITQAYLKSLLFYHPETGDFFWLERKKGRRMYRPAGVAKKNGYQFIGIDYCNYLSHRLAWLYMTGEWPDKWIDHVNGNPADNRFSNLRQATPTENQFNRNARKPNGTGVRGVSKVGNSYIVKLRIEGKPKYLGSFEDLELAEFVARSAREKHHGGFACHV